MTVISLSVQHARLRTLTRDTASVMSTLYLNKHKATVNKWSDNLNRLEYFIQDEYTKLENQKEPDLDQCKLSALFYACNIC